MKEWSKCSIQERKLIDCILRLNTVEQMVKITGYAKTTIAKKKTELKEAVAERMCMVDNQRIANVQQCQEQLTRIALGIDKEQFYDKEVGFRFKEINASDRIKALTTLLKAHGAFVEKQEIQENKVIQIEVLGDRVDHENTSC